MVTTAKPEGLCRRYMGMRCDMGATSKIGNPVNYRIFRGFWPLRLGGTGEQKLRPQQDF